MPSQTLPSIRVELRMAAAGPMRVGWPLLRQVSTSGERLAQSDRQRAQPIQKGSIKEVFAGKG